MSRTQLFFLLLGVILIVGGLLLDPGSGDSQPAVRAAVLDEPAPDRARDPAPRKLSTGAVAASPERVSVSPPSEPPPTVRIEVLALEKGTAKPSPGAQLELWRSATGTLDEPSYRPAKRLSPRGQAADERGRVTFQAKRGLSVAVTGRTADGGPLASVDLDPITAESPPSVQVEIELELPPAPLELRVVNPAGEPLPGVSIWLVPRGAQRWAEFPGGARIARRTDGEGRCTLDGTFRAQGWLAIDGAGRAPRVLEVDSLANERELQLELEPGVVAQIAVQDASGSPAAKVRVELRFELDGHATVRSGVTSRRGVAVLRRLPFGCEIYPLVEPEDGGTPHRFGAIRFNREQAEGRSQAGPRVELRLP